MKTSTTSILTKSVSYFFVLLFVYASVSKILDFENFQVQIAQSPLLSAYAGVVSYGVLIIELLTAGFLLIPRCRTAGLYASFALMTAFTAYIYLILNYSDFIPCSCGGILEKLGWREHLIFNFVCIILAVVALSLTELLHSVSFKKLSLRISLTFIASVGMMTILFLSSEHIIKKENNFTRRFLPHPISNEKAIDLKASSFYFAGHRGDTVFLGNREAPLLMTTLLPSYLYPEMDTLKLSDYKKLSSKFPILFSALQMALSLLFLKVSFQSSPVKKSVCSPLTSLS